MAASTLHQEQFPGIDVVVPGDNPDPEHDSEIPNRTQLYRPDCHIPRILALGYGILDLRDSLTIVSAGCSTGAEIDTILSYHAMSAQSGVLLALHGIDASKRAIDKAESAQHTLPSTYYGIRSNPTTLSEAEAALKAGGFKTTYIPKGWVSEWVFERGGYLIADSSDLRARHEVTFTHADLTSEAPEEENADIAFIDNVLYHLQPLAATKLLRNTASMLNPDAAVLSLGSMGNGWASSRRMGRPGDYSSVSYRDWVSFAEPILFNEFGMQRVEMYGNSKSDPVHVFVRQHTSDLSTG